MPMFRELSRAQTRLTLVSAIRAGESRMQGIHFIVDDQQQQVAVVIDLKQYGELWEDFYDSLLAARREDEPRTALEELKTELVAQGKLCSA